MKDSLDRIGILDPVMLVLPCFDKGRPHVKPVALRRVWFGIYEVVYLFERSVVVFLSLDRLNVNRPISYTQAHSKDRTAQYCPRPLSSLQTFSASAESAKCAARMR